MTRRQRAIIIGAGISGMISGIMLHRLGWEVEIYEQSLDIRRGAGGLALWPNATHALRRMGLLHETSARGKTVTKAEIRRADGRLIIDLPLHRLTNLGQDLTLGILRSQLFEALFVQLQDIPIHTGRRFTHYYQHGHEVTACFADGSESACDLLIGADGINSTVRRCLHGKQELHIEPAISWRGTVHSDHEYSRDGVSFESWGSGRRFGMLPVGDTTVYWFVVMLQDVLEEDWKATYKKGRMEWLVNKLADFADPVPAIIAQTSERDVLQSPMTELLPVPRWVSNRVLLIGDAAHAFTPNLGQGACMAIEDVEVLASCMAAEPDLEAALLRYERNRTKRAGRMRWMSRYFGRAATLQQPLLAAARDVAVRGMPPRVERKVWRSIFGYEGRLER